MALTYNLNRLQGHSSPEPLCITLNEIQTLAAEKILQRIVYHHPIYGRSALEAQKRFADIHGRHRTYYCGAYWGYGFHEDGVRSALAVGERFGRRLESC